MAVIGIDPGTALTGFGIIQEGKNQDIELIDYGVIRTPAKTPPEKRLLSIYQQLIALIHEHNISCAAVEKLYFQQNTTTALSVGQARGVVILALEQNGIAINEYNPIDIKQAITGYGRASKRQMQEMVKVLLGLDKIPKPDDAADALAVAICHLHSRKMRDIGR